MALSFKSLLLIQGQDTNFNGMNMNNNYSIIMAGGIGSRFWPLSTPQHPKQFLDVLGLGKTLIQMTYDRLIKISPSENVFILTNEEYKELVLEQLPDLKPSQVLTEPIRKNTAPCIAYAAAKIHSINPNANLIVSPADHLIIQEDLFCQDLNQAIKAAENDRIVTIGIQPTRPDTGYGYIEFDNLSKKDITEVIQFREKPDLETAKSFVSAGNFYWNSGIFIWKSTTVLNALKEFQPKLYESFCSNLEAYNSDGEQQMVNEAFHNCEDISVDFAIMEHAKNIDVVKSHFNWSDLGTWGSLDSHLKKDGNNNSIIGGNIVVENTKNTIINIPEGNEAIIDGLDNCIVIQSGKRLMILQKENEQDLKHFMQKLK